MSRVETKAALRSTKSRMVVGSPRSVDGEDEVMSPREKSKAILGINDFGQDTPVLTRTESNLKVKKHKPKKKEKKKK